MTVKDMGCRTNVLHLLSDEAKIRKASPIKTTMKYFSDPNIVFLGAGMPSGNMFPFESISFKSVSLDDVNGTGAVEGCIHRDRSDLEICQDVPLGVALQYGNSRGQPELISFLKEHTSIFHNISINDWDLITTAGSTQAWDACLRLFCNRGETVLMEEYTYSSSLEAAVAQGLNCVAMKMDKDGIKVDKLSEMLRDWDVAVQGPFPKLLYTIPNGHNPTGCTLHEERKPELVRLASQYDFIIIEDDPYYFLQMNEFGAPELNVPGDVNEMQWFKENFVNKLGRSLLEWDDVGRIIRLESVSKTFAPGCRLGWAIGPRYLLDHLWNYHEVSMQSTCGFAQTLINGMFQRWGQIGYMKWLLRLRNSYSMKRDHCLTQCQKYLPNEVCSINLPISGMFFMVYIDPHKHPKFEREFKSKVDLLEEHLYNSFVQNGMLLACSSWFRVDPNHNKILAFRGSYASVDAEKMQNGIIMLGNVIKAEFCL